MDSVEAKTATDDVDVTAYNANGIWTFVMPEEAVNVTITYVEEGE